MSAYESRMAALAERFRERARADSGRIEAALAEGDRAALARICHALAGNAGIFGHAVAGDAAERVELAVESGLPEAELGSLCARLLAELQRVG